MLFGLTNALASFQRYINKIFMEKPNIIVIVYLDIILIYTKDDGDSHVTAIQCILELLKKFLLFVNLKNCLFYYEEVWFIGYMIFSKDIRIKDIKIETVK